jgi:FkbM family methyltransferase
MTRETSGRNTTWSLLELFDEAWAIDVLDVGAALNDTPPYQALVAAGRARVIGFEPNQAECERLNAAYGGSHKFIPFFLGDGGAATFHETNWVLTGSLFAPNTRLLEKFGNLGEVTMPVGQHPVTTTRADDIPEIGNVDFFKIDVQGAELSVFQNATRVLGDALIVHTEVEFLELYKEQPLFADVDTFLRRQGFVFHTFDGFGMRAFKPLVRDFDANLGFRQYLWSDAIYVRDWLCLEKLPDEKLKKFAVLAHDVLGSFDLAHLVLSELERRSGVKWTEVYRERFNSSSRAGGTNFGRRSGVASQSPSRVQPGTSAESLVNATCLMATREGITLVLPRTLDCITTYVILEQERWFEKELDFLRRWIKPGMSLVDVGANVGAYALPLARLAGEKGRVWAYEPGTGNRECLLAGIMENRLSNVIVSGSALSNRVSDGWLASGPSGESHALLPSGQQSASGEPVRVSTLDEECRRQSWHDIDFIKIDAEGQEAQVIVGGREFLAAASPLVMYEVKHGDENHHDLRWLFEVLGYRNYRLTGDAGFLCPVQDEALDEFTLNLFAAKPDRAAQLAAAGLLIESTEPFILTEAERDDVLTKILALPFAIELEFSFDDFDVDAPYTQALMAYGAYRFLACPLQRKQAALEYACDQLVDLCNRDPSAARLATLVRAAISAHRIEIALAALERLRRMQGSGLAGECPSIDEPFFPPCERYEALPIGDDPGEWFACATLESIERISAPSSRFGGIDLKALEGICNTEYVSPELFRRYGLKSTLLGLSPPRPKYLDRLQHVNAAYWPEGPDWLAAIRQLSSGRSEETLEGGRK